MWAPVAASTGWSRSLALTTRLPESARSFRSKPRKARYSEAVSQMLKGADEYRRHQRLKEVEEAKQRQRDLEAEEDAAWDEDEASSVYSEQRVY